MKLPGSEKQNSSKSVCFCPLGGVRAVTWHCTWHCAHNNVFFCQPKAYVNFRDLWISHVFGGFSVRSDLFRIIIECIVTQTLYDNIIRSNFQDCLYIYNSFISGVFYPRAIAEGDTGLPVHVLVYYFKPIYQYWSSTVPISMFLGMITIHVPLHIRSGWRVPSWDVPDDKRPRKWAN